MKKLFLIPVFALVCMSFAVQGGAQDKKDQDKKVKEKEPVGALPPHPLDKAMEKAITTTALTNALLNDKLFHEAVKNAVAAKLSADKEKGKIGPSPAQAARQAFLRTIQAAEKVMEKKLEEKKKDEKVIDVKKDEKPKDK